MMESENYLYVNSDSMYLFFFDSIAKFFVFIRVNRTIVSSLRIEWGTLLIGDNNYYVVLDLLLN